jgi:hypothetical protein
MQRNTIFASIASFYFKKTDAYSEKYAIIKHIQYLKEDTNEKNHRAPAALVLCVGRWPLRQHQQRELRSRKIMISLLPPRHRGVYPYAAPCPNPQRPTTTAWLPLPRHRASAENCSNLNSKEATWPSCRTTFGLCYNGPSDERGRRSGEPATIANHYPRCCRSLCLGERIESIADFAESASPWAPPERCEANAPTFRRPTASAMTTSTSTTWVL